MDQAHKDEEHEQRDRLEQRDGRLAAREMKAEEIDQHDRVEQGNLPLERAVALAQQRPAKCGLRLPNVEKAVQPKPDADRHIFGLAQTG